MTFHCAPKLVVAAVTFILANVGLTALQERNAHAAPLTCAEIQVGTGLYNDRIIAGFEEQLAGEEFRITKRKTLRIDGLAELYADNDCNLTVVVNVTLKRRLLPDAHGTATVRAHVTSAEVTESTTLELYLDHKRVTNVELSHIGEVRERIFESLANFVIRLLPDSVPIIIPL